jgi:hypothetical protein
VYLIFVPDTKWYVSRLAERYDAEVQKRRDDLKAKIIPTLRPEMASRFDRMETMYRGIKAQQADDPVRTASGWFREVLRKLEFLLEKFLQFASKEVQFRAYLFSVLQEVRADGRTGNEPDNKRGNRSGNRSNGGRDGDEEQNKLWDAWIAEELRQRRRPSRHQPANSQPPLTAQAPPPPPKVPTGQVQEIVDEIQKHYDKELASLRQSNENETDEGTKAVVNKRIEVLQRRRDFIGKIGKVLMNLNHQLMLLEDTMGLISDEIRARPPEQVLADIDDVVWQTKTMTELLDEVGPFESAMASASTQDASTL